MGGHHHHLHDNYGPEARYAVEREAELPTTKWEEEVARGLELGLPGADSIVDKRIPTFSRGELPHFAGINTFLKAPYVEDVRRCGEYDVAVLGAPFDGGTTYRSGTRFGPQGIRKISALYGPYSFELGVDLRESITIARPRRHLHHPGEHREDLRPDLQGGRRTSTPRGAFPVVLGGDHSIGYPTVRGVAAAPAAATSASSTSTATSTPRRPTSTSGCTPRRGSTPPTSRTCRRRTWCRSASAAGRRRGPGVKVGRERGTTIMTVTDCVEMGIEAAAERALEVAWDGADAVWLSFDVDCLDAAFVPGTGWPEPGGFLPREVLKFIQLIAERPLAGIEVVECSPPYDNAEITSLIATRVICDTLGCLVRAGHLPARPVGDTGGTS